MVDPDLHADLAERRLGLGGPEIDPRPERVQRDAALAVPLAPRHLRPTEPAAALNPNAEGARAHRGLYRPAHGTAEAHAAGELLGDALREQGRVGLRSRLRGGRVHVLDLHVHALLRDPLDVLADPIDLGALSADHDARASGPDVDPDLVALALDVDARDARAGQAGADVLADPDVLVQMGRVLAARVPVGLPGVDDPQPESVRIDLVTHYSSSPNERTTSVMCDVRFKIFVARP